MRVLSRSRSRACPVPILGLVMPFPPSPRALLDPQSHPPELDFGQHICSYSRRIGVRHGSPVMGLHSKRATGSGQAEEITDVSNHPKQRSARPTRGSSRSGSIPAACSPARRHRITDPDPDLSLLGRKARGPRWLRAVRTPRQRGRLMRPATASTFPGAVLSTRHPMSCVRLLSLADGANGAPPYRVPRANPLSGLALKSDAGGPHGLGRLPISRAGAARARSHRSTTSNFVSFAARGLASGWAAARRTAAPATVPTARVGLVDRSIRPAGLLPAGITEGEAT
jgi:hypothetical protein